MDLFCKRLRRREERDLAGRIAALEDYVEYLRQQGEYGASMAGKKNDGREGAEER